MVILANSRLFADPRPLKGTLRHPMCKGPRYRIPPCLTFQPQLLGFGISGADDGMTCIVPPFVDAVDAVTVWFNQVGTRRQESFEAFCSAPLCRSIDVF